MTFSKQVFWLPRLWHQAVADDTSVSSGPAGSATMSSTRVGCEATTAGTAAEMPSAAAGRSQ